MWEVVVVHDGRLTSWPLLCCLECFAHCSPTQYCSIMQHVRDSRKHLVDVQYITWYCLFHKGIFHLGKRYKTQNGQETCKYRDFPVLFCLLLTFVWFQKLSIPPSLLKDWEFPRGWCEVELNLDYRFLNVICLHIIYNKVSSPVTTPNMKKRDKFLFWLHCALEIYGGPSRTKMFGLTRAKIRPNILAWQEHYTSLTAAWQSEPNTSVN